MFDQTVETLLEPCATSVRGVFEGDLIPPGSLVLGDGALRHRDILESPGNSILDLPVGGASASGLLRLFSMVPSVTPLKNPGRWEPDYLRETGAVRLPKYGGGREG
jgi:hypothetical protein